MKKLLASVLIVILCVTAFAACSSSSKQDWEYIEGKKEMVIGYTLFEPMNYKDESGALVGFDTEFAEALCAELGISPKFVIINWDTKEVELNAKNIDCIWNGFTVNAERKELVDFSMSYLINKQVVVIKKSNEDKYKTVEDMKGASCTAEKKSAGEVAIQEDAILKENKYTPADKQTDVLLEIKSGTSELGVIDFVMAKSMIGPDTDYDDLMIVTGVELAPEEYAIGFRKGSPETLTKINDTIKKLAQAGKLSALAEKYNLTDELASDLK